MKKVRETFAVLALALLMPIWVMAAEPSNSDPSNPIAGAAECDTAMMECYITGNDGGSTKYTYDEAASLLGQYVGPVTAGVSCEPFMPVCMNGGREVLGANPNYSMAAAQAAQAEALGQGSNSQPSVTQQLPLEIKWSGGDFYFTATVDNVTINKVTINRGNCKTLNFSNVRQGLEKDSYLTPSNLRNFRREPSRVGILKFGEVKIYNAGNNCIPRELNIETDLGSWTVTLNEV